MKQKHIRDGAEFFFLLALVAIVLNLICLRAEIVTGSSSDFSVHPVNGIEYLIESNCLRQKEEEIVVLEIFFYSRAIKKSKDK